MFHNVAKMTHQLQHGDAEPLRVASPSNTLPAHEGAHHNTNSAIDTAFAAKCSEQIDDNLSIEDVIDCLCEIDVDDKHDGDAQDDQGTET